MIRYALCSLAVLAPTAARAADPPDPPAADKPAAGATGSPSNAVATVSPSTVADAAMRADDKTTPAASESRFGISVGTALASGNFGSQQDSRLWSTAFGARYALGTLRLTASIPYLEIRSRGIIYSGIDSTPVIVAGGTPGPRARAHGFGDATLGAALTLPASDTLPEIEVSGRVKLPTATRASKLSTGKADYSAGVQLTRTLGRFAPFVSATYRIFGDPAGIRLRNGFAASAGTSLTVGERAVLLVSYHYAQAASGLVRDSHELFAGASARLPHSPLRLTGFATAGVSSGAAARSGGISLALDF